MVYRARGSPPFDEKRGAVSEPVAGRYRGVAPLPAIGGVPRELALDQVADHRVALARVPSGAGVDRARILAASYQTCRHASLAPILDIADGEDGGIVVVEAQSDGPILATVADLPYQTALLLAADLADALTALHRAGLVHGALDADSVVLDAAGRGVVCGAGLAALREVSAGLPVGVAADDVRALGRLVYRMITGRAPAVDPEPPIALVPSTTPALNGLVMAMLSDDPLRPPPPVEAVAARLRALSGAAYPVDVVPATAAPAALPRPRAPRAPRKGLSDSALAAIVGGIALAAIVLAAVGAGAGGFIDASDLTGDDVPTFTLPQTEPLTLTVTDEEILPLPEDEFFEEDLLTEDEFFPEDEIITGGEEFEETIEEFTITGDNLEEDIITVE